MKRFYKFLLPLVAIAAMAMPWNVKAQSLVEYTLQTNTTTYTSIANADSLLSSVTGDAGIQAVTLPFAFPFGESTYTSVTVRADGYLYFGSTAPGHSTYSTWTNTTTNYSLIAPIITYDGKITANGATSGAYKAYMADENGNMMVVIEFKSVQCYYGDYGNYNVQVRLYPNGNITAVYGTCTPTTYSSMIHNFFLINGIGDKICLTGSFASPVASSTVASLPNLSTMPASGTMITYVRPVLTCPKPMIINAITDTDQITFYWPHGGTESSWEFMMDSVSYTVSDTFYTATGLIPDTRYDVAVRAICSSDDTSGWRTGSFRTDCAPLYNLPYTENFEEYGSGSTYPISACWTKGTSSSTPYPYPSSTVVSGTRSLYFYGYNSTSSTPQYCWAALPPIDDNLDMSNLMVTMKVKRGSTSSTYYTTLVYIGVADSVIGFSSATAIESNVTWIDTLNYSSAAASSIHDAEISFADYTGNGKYVVIYVPVPPLQGSNTYCYNYAYIDDVVLRTIPTCFWPTSVSLGSVSYDGATISWTPDPRTANPSAWNVEYGPHGFTQGNGTSTSSTSTSITLTGLLANTEYDVYISADCGGEESDPTMFTFRTECTLLDSLPYTYGFEDLATGSSTVRPVIPCWHHLNNGTSSFGYPYVTSTAHNGTRSLYWYNTTTTGTYGDYMIVVLPGVDPDVYPINSLQLTFWARPSSTSYHPVFEVGVMTDPDDATTFQSLETVNVQNVTTWQVFTVSLGAYTGTGIYAAVRMNRASSSYYAYTDDFTLEPLPNCPAITNLEATPTVGAAMLTWGYQAGYDAPAGGFVVTYDSIGGTNPTTVTVTETSTVLTGLEAGTDYKVYIRANCATDGLGALDSITFTTGEFECFGRSEVAIGQSTTGISGCLAYSSWGNTVYQTVWTAAELTAAGVTAGPITALDLGFTSSTYAKEFTIYLGTTTTSSISNATIEAAALQTKVYGPAAHPIGTEGWQHYELDTVFVWDGTSNIMMTTFMNQPTGTSQSSSSGLTGYYVSATNKARYRYQDNTQWTTSNLTGGSSGSTYSYRAAIRFYVGACTGMATCANPLVMVTDKNSNSVSLAWVPGANETSWDVDYRAVDTLTWTNAATGTSSNTITITSLAPGTDYEFRVSFTCNDGNSTMYASTVTTRTSCVEISLPYTYGFEDLPTNSSSVHPDIPCWTHLNNGTSYPGYPYVTSTAHTGTRSLYWYLTTTTGTYGDYEIVVLPPVDTVINPVNTLRLKFWAKPTGTSYAPVFLVGVMTDPDNVSTFQTVQTINVEHSTTDWMEYEAYLNNYIGTGRYVAIRANRPSSSWYAYLDDVELSVIPTCPHVSNIHTTLNTGDSIMLTWTPGSEESEWIVTFGDTTIATTEDSVLITNLSHSTHYYGTITAVCSSDDSSEAYPFHIMSACGQLTNLPYVQDFEAEMTTTSSSSTFIPCWGHLNNGTSYPGYPYVSASTTYNHTENGGKGLYWYGSTTTGTYGDYYAIILPEVDTLALPINTLKLSFWAKSSSTSYQPIFYVGVMSDPNDINSFIYYDTINVGSNTTWTRYTTIFDSWVDSGSYIAIRGNRPATTWYAYMDDIELDVMPACPPVEDVAVIPGVTSAIVTWNTVSAANTGAMVEYKADTADTWNSATANGNYAVLTGLDAFTAYQVRVYATCDEGNASAVNGSFTTRDFGCAVMDPTNSHFDTVTGTTVTSYQRPVNNFYRNTFSEQIYDSTELGAAGPIVSFSLNYGYSTPMSDKTNVMVYMANTTLSTISTTSYITPTNMTLVYSGSINCSQGWNEFLLDVPFNYSGGNLAVAFVDNSGEYDGSAYVWNGHSATGKSFSWYSDSYTYPNSSMSTNTDAFRPDMAFSFIDCIQQSTCAAPVVYVTGTTSSTASIVWGPGNSDTVWNVYYRHANDANYTLAASNVTATSYTFTGLNGGSMYNFKVENICDNESFATEVEAVTECAAITLPFTEDFNSWGTGSGVLPNCWYRTGSYSTYTYISPSYNMSGSTGGSIYMYQGSSTPYTAYASTLILPELDTTLYQANQTQLVFGAMYATATYGRPKFEVGVVSDPQDFSTFVPVDTVQHSGGINRWETFEVPLAAYTGTGAYVAMRTVFDSAYTYPYVDNFTLELIPTCPRPDSLTAGNATTSSVDLGWHERGTATQWIIEYGPMGFELGTGTQVVANTNPFTLTGIPASYQGDYYVKSICGAGDTGEYSRISCGFNTSQPPATLPYDYDFENPAEWANWQLSSNNASTWCRGTAVADSGSYSMYVSADNGATYKPYTYSAIVNATAYRDVDFGTIDSSYTLTFRARAGGTISNYYDGLMVFLVDQSMPTVPSTSGITTPWGSVNDLYRIATVRLDTTWQTYEASFDTIHGVHRVAFFWFNQNTEASYPNLGEPAAVDNLHIDYSSCPRPLNLTAVPSTNTALLSWDGPASATYEITYRQVGGANQSVIATTNSFNLTGLTSPAEYRAWVRKICGAGDTSLYCDGVAFTTLCSPLDLPFTEDFNSVTGTTYSTAGDLPLCWEGFSNGTDDAYFPHVVGSGSYWYSNDNTNALTLTSGSATYGDTKIVALPILNADLSTCKMYFYYRMESTSYGDLEVGYFSGYDVEHDFVPVDTMTRTTTITYDSVSFAGIPSTAVRLGFRWIHNASYYSVGIDNITVTGQPGGCQPPAIASIAKDYQSATITVTGNGSNFELEYGTSLTTLGNLMTSTTGVFNITGLTPATTYFFHVRQTCDVNDVSNWGEGYFTTDSLPCMEVTGLQVTGTSYNSVSLSWTAGGNETAWEVKVYSTVDSVSITSQTANATVTGLMPQRTYNVIVRPMCGSNANIEGPWCDPVTFTTDACQPVSDVTVSGISNTSATVSWTAPAGATNFRVAYGYTGFSQGEELDIYNTTTNPFALTDLEANTGYTVQVAVVCTESLVSAYVGADFTTTNVGIDGADMDNALSLYPNPASSVVTLRVGEKLVGSTMSIVDVNGRVVMSETLTSETLTIDLSEIAKGAYFVRLTGEQATVVRKLIVK